MGKRSADDDATPATTSARSAAEEIVVRTELRPGDIGGIVLRGRGLGKRLLAEALEFCRAAGYESVFLWTVRGLEPAGALYRAFGFRLTLEERHLRWGADVVEERLDLALG